MPNRVITFLLAFVLLWSGLSTIEVPSALAQRPSPGPQYTILDAGEPAVPQQGSVEQHHLDDLPSQAHNDSPAETPALLPPPLKPVARASLSGRRHTLPSVAAGSPFLVGLLRPPCNALAG